MISFPKGGFPPIIPKSIKQVVVDETNISREFSNKNIISIKTILNEENTNPIIDMTSILSTVTAPLSGHKTSSTVTPILSENKSEIDIPDSKLYQNNYLNKFFYFLYWNKKIWLRCN